MQIEKLLENGDIRVGWEWRGKSWAYQIKERDFYEQCRGGHDMERVARMLASTVASQQAMDKRAEDTGHAVSP